MRGNCLLATSATSGSPFVKVTSARDADFTSASILGWVHFQTSHNSRDCSTERNHFAHTKAHTQKQTHIPLTNQQKQKGTRKPSHSNTYKNKRESTEIASSRDLLLLPPRRLFCNQPVSHHAIHIEASVLNGRQYQHHPVEIVIFLFLPTIVSILFTVHAIVRRQTPIRVECQEQQKEESQVFRREWSCCADFQH